MPHFIQSTEGIILRVIPFQDYHQIVSIFTLGAGLIKVLHKGSRSQRKNGKSPCMPLTKVEVSYYEKKGEIFGCHELNCTDMFSNLRTDLCFLETGCDLLQVILDSQLMGKEAPLLYHLLYTYLKKIPQTANPWLLAASFRLKLLKHDGLIGFPFICNECGNVLYSEIYTRDSESWCAVHRPKQCIEWDATELRVIYRLAESQSFTEISLLDLSPILLAKITLFFTKCLHVY